MTRQWRGRVGLVACLPVAAVVAACGNAHSEAEIEAAANRGAVIQAPATDAAVPGATQPTLNAAVPTQGAVTPTGAVTTSGPGT